MQKSEQGVLKDSAWFPFTFRSKRPGLQVRPFLLNTCEPSALGHHQCISTSSPVGFLHLRKDRDDIWSLTAGRITCKSCLPTCHLACCWHMSHELSNSQWGLVQLSIQQPRYAPALWKPAHAGCAATSSELRWISWSLTVLYTILKTMLPWT